MTTRHLSTSIKSNVKVNPEKVDEIGFQRSLSVKMNIWDNEPQSPKAMIEDKIEEVEEDIDKSKVTHFCPDMFKSNQIFNNRAYEYLILK